MRDREERLLKLLSEKPFLIVLDGLERAMELYAREDTSPLPRSDKNSDVELIPRHPLRRTRDPRLGEFLQKLVGLARHGRSSARAFTRRNWRPRRAQSMLDCHRHDLGGLSDDEALERGVFRSGGEWLARTTAGMFNNCGNHPLLIRVLAGLVARHADAPGNFEHWLQEHSDLRSFIQDIVRSLWQKRTHIMAVGLGGLKQSAHNLLYIIAAFRTPIPYTTLAALMPHEGRNLSVKGLLRETLADLEDRGLLSWDRTANCYDMHPVTRWVVWDKKVSVSWTELRANPRVNSIEELTPAIKLYENLISLKFYEDAMRLFLSRLERPLLYHLSANRRRIELLEQLFRRAHQPRASSACVTKPSFSPISPTRIR